MGDDVGNSLKPYVEQTGSSLKYDFADEGVFLSTKTYALRSKYTGKEFIKGKGISAWMIDPTAQQRREFNLNKDAIGFSDYIKCINGEQNLIYSAIQFGVESANLHQKKGNTLVKEVACVYK